MQTKPAVLNYHHETEKNIIAALLMEPELLSSCMARIIPEAFHMSDYRETYTKMLDLHKQGLDCDYDTVTAFFKDDEFVGGGKLFDMVAGPAKVSRIESWCKVLMDLHTRRILYGAGQTLSMMAEGQENPEKGAREVIGRCNKAMELGKYKSSVETSDILNESLDYIQRINTDLRAYVVPYIIKGVDNEIKHARKQIHVLAAPPNTGKTGFALSVLEAQAQHGIKHVIFCHETPRVNLMNRLISMRASLSSEELYEVATSGKMERLTGAVKSLREQSSLLRLYGSGDYSHSVEGIYSALENMIEAGYRPDMVTVDYLQNLKPSLSVARAPRAEQMENMVLELSRMFKTLDIAGLWLSQINRDKNRDHQGKDFINADLKGSSAIEQEADYITFLQRLRPADVKGFTSMGWKSTKMRAGHVIGCEIGFNIDNGKFLRVIDRFSGVVDSN